MWPASWRVAWQIRWRRWIAKRIPPQREQTLNQRNIFIFPTAFGAFYLLVTALLFTIGLNYQNNSVYAFCFFLVAVFVAAIMPTFNNLHGLTFRTKSHVVTTVGQPTDVVVYVSAEQRTRCQLALCHDPIVVFDVIPDQQCDIHLALTMMSPGVHRLQSLKLESVYPLGLYRAWTWLSLANTLYAAPRPLRVSDLAQLIDTQGRAAQWQWQENEERELREFRPGDGARDIYWRRAVGEGPLLSKTRGVQRRAASPQGLLDYHRSTATQHLAKLADLCFWVLHCDAQGVPFGLILPATSIALDSGASHRKRCLMALAEAV